MTATNKIQLVNVQALEVVILIMDKHDQHVSPCFQFVAKQNFILLVLHNSREHIRNQWL